jgi:hypothetical protein
LPFGIARVRHVMRVTTRIVPDIANAAPLRCRAIGAAQ